MSIIKGLQLCPLCVAGADGGDGCVPHARPRGEELHHRAAHQASSHLDLECKCPLALAPQPAGWLRRAAAAAARMPSNTASPAGWLAGCAQQQQQ